MDGQIILGWQTMQVVYCAECGDLGLEAPYGGRHVAGRVSPQAVCLGRRYSFGGLGPSPPREHMRPWWKNVPPRLRRFQGQRRPMSPEPHSRAWDYLPPAPVEWCSCGYSLAWSWRVAWTEARWARCDEILLYCQGLGSGIVYEGGARMEAFRILAFTPRWCDDERSCPFMRPSLRDEVRARWGPEIPDPSSLPTGVFDQVPPEAAALLEGAGC